jgi:hypothetical protein
MAFTDTTEERFDLLLAHFREEARGATVEEDLIDSDDEENES